MERKFKGLTTGRKGSRGGRERRYGRLKWKNQRKDKRKNTKTRKITKRTIERVNGVQTANKNEQSHNSKNT